MQIGNLGKKNIFDIGWWDAKKKFGQVGWDPGKYNDTEARH